MSGEAYIILGHGEEDIARHGIVPEGCILVLTEECGMSGTFPAYMYDVISDPENLELFLDPTVNRAAIEKLFKKRIRIYTAGERYPYLMYTLISDNDRGVEPSGVYRLPVSEDAMIANLDDVGITMYTFKEADAAFEESLRPTADEVAGKTAREIKALAQTHATQEELFAAFPGVHYSLLCRAIPGARGRIRGLLVPFPSEKLEHLLDMNPLVDPWGAVTNWAATLDRASLTPEQAAALAELERQAAEVMGHRAASGSPLEPHPYQRLFRLYQQGAKADKAAVLAALAAIPDANINQHGTHDGNTPLMIAVRLEMMDAVDAVLARPGVSVNATSFVGMTALHYAAQKGNAPIVERLLNAGASTVTVDEGGETPLMYAVKKPALIALLPRLIENAALMTDEYGDNALHKAAGGSVVEAIPLLLAAGININRPNNDGETPLSTACAKGPIAMVEALMGTAGIKLKSPRAFGNAVKAKREDIAITLAEAGSFTRDFDKVIAYARTHRMDKLVALAERLKGESGAAAGGGGGAADTN